MKNELARTQLVEAARKAQLMGLADFLAELIASNILTLKDDSYTQEEAIDRLAWLRLFISYLARNPGLQAGEG